MREGYRLAGKVRQLRVSGIREQRNNFVHRICTYIQYGRGSGKIFSNAHRGSDRFVIIPKRMELDEIDTTGAAAASKEERL